MPKEFGLDTPSLSSEAESKNPIDKRGGLLIDKKHRDQWSSAERKRLLDKYSEQLRALALNPFEKEVWNLVYLYGDITRVRDIFLQTLDETEEELDSGGSIDPTEVNLALQRNSDSYDKPMQGFMSLREGGKSLPTLAEVDAKYEERQARLTERLGHLQQVVDVLDGIVLDKSA